MVVTASYGLSGVEVTTAEVTGYAISPSVLTDGTTHVTISYTEMGTTMTATQAITVIHRLSSIAVITNPTKTTYEYGDTLATAGMVVRATYSDGTTADVTSYSCSPTTLNTVTNSQAITVSYAENGVTETTSFSVVVDRKSVTKPTWKSNLTYSGSSQSVSATTNWNNYNTTYMTIGGTTSATNAGTYTATFTLKDNYRWADGTTTTLDVSWTINKATGTSALSSTSVAIDGNNLTKTVTVSGNFDGAVSISPTTVAGLTLSVSGKTITITGNGSTAVASTTITVIVAAGANYTAPTNKTFTVTATYWEWGSETAVGDAAWWAGLKSWAATATASERAACVGKTKMTSLSTAVLGANNILMRCIGADRDGTGTLTFHSAGGLPTSTTFGSSTAWINSTARSLCQNIYDYCSAKASIKTVSKGLAAYNSRRNGAVTYTDETVWLPSEREMGLDNYSSLSTANSTTSKAECTQGYNASYSYYTSNSTRVKYKAAANGTLTTTTVYYWERSRYYNDSTGVCGVNTDGSANFTYYDDSSALAPAFVIG